MVLFYHFVVPSYTSWVRFRPTDTSNFSRNMVNCILSCCHETVLGVLHHSALFMVIQIGFFDRFRHRFAHENYLMSPYLPRKILNVICIYVKKSDVAKNPLEGLTAFVLFWKCRDFLIGWIIHFQGRWLIQYWLAKTELHDLPKSFIEITRVEI